MFKKNKNKIDVNNMTPEELDEYVKSLPESAPPKWSSVGWLAAMGVIGTITSIAGFDATKVQSWTVLVLTLLVWVGVGYLIYKILSFNQGG